MVKEDFLPKETLSMTVIVPAAVALKFAPGGPESEGLLRNLAEAERAPTNHLFLIARDEYRRRRRRRRSTRYMVGPAGVQ